MGGKKGFGCHREPVVSFEVEVCHVGKKNETNARGGKSTVGKRKKE
jgi:hypothetical protein